MRSAGVSRAILATLLASTTLAGCSSGGGRPELPPASFVAAREQPGEEYVIGPLDELTVFVGRNPELGAKVQVRPDGWWAKCSRHGLVDSTDLDQYR